MTRGEESCLTGQIPKETIDLIARSICNEMDIWESADLAVAIMAEGWETNKEHTTEYLMDAIERRFMKEENAR